MPPIINIKRKIKRERNAAMRETAKRSTLIENMLKAKLHFSAQTQQGHTTRIWWLGKHSQCNSSGDLRDIAQTLPKLNLDWRQDCQSICLFLRQDGLQLCTINVLQSQWLWNSDWGVARVAFVLPHQAHQLGWVCTDGMASNVRTPPTWCLGWA